ncbi:hypothetical protein TNCV_3383441 [Trichonephila clavipes]|nr:hypothetical protein TNCV_3383441 [Trichonephila clavipes]
MVGMSKNENSYMVKIHPSPRKKEKETLTFLLPGLRLPEPLACPFPLKGGMGRMVIRLHDLRRGLNPLSSKYGVDIDR